MTSLPKLPIGIQTFDDIRNNGYLYVDKTRYLVDIIDTGKVYFLSRPRRFGKSLTISTFDALFSGKKDLFSGLYAESYFERPGYKPHASISAKGGTDAGKLADEALSQIEEKGYAEPFGDAVLLGLAIDVELRRVAEYRFRIR
jgi:hypothetical protein